MAPSSTPAAGHIGRNIAFMRGRIGISQSELAAITGIHQTQISKLERGDTAGPSLATAQALAASFRLTVDELSGSPDRLLDILRTRDMRAELEDLAIEEAEELLLTSKAQWTWLRAAVVDELIHYVRTGESAAVTHVSHSLIQHLPAGVGLRWPGELAPAPHCSTVSINATDSSSTVRETEPSALAALLLGAEHRGGVDWLVRDDAIVEVSPIGAGTR